MSESHARRRGREVEGDQRTIAQQFRSQHDLCSGVTRALRKITQFDTFIAIFLTSGGEERANTQHILLCAQNVPLRKTANDSFLFVPKQPDAILSHSFRSLSIRAMLQRLALTRSKSVHSVEERCECSPSAFNSFAAEI